MRKLISALVFVSLLSKSYAEDSARQTLTGTYELLGSNPGSTKYTYKGTVQIDSYGSNYFLTWNIGSHGQTQIGVGIFENDTLSVSYYGGSDDRGVVSYQLQEDGSLEGKWAGLFSSNYGRETLTLIEE